MEEPFASVVICTYNRGEMLKECLDSLLYQTYPKDRYEIIVVNDGSTDGTEEILVEYQKKASCKFRWFAQENKGLSVARNTGIKNSEGEIICFTDDDCIADKDWIIELVNGYKDNGLGSVGGKIRAYDAYTLIERYINERKLLNQERFFTPLVGANTSYTRDIIVKTGFFDESFMSCEDVDFAIRVKIQGFESKYNPKAIVYHKHRATLKGLMKQQYNYGRGYARLHKKYTKDFLPRYNLVLIPLKIIHRIFAYPVRIVSLPFVDDKRYYLAEPLLDIMIFISHFLGIVKETFFAEPYRGEKYSDKLDFLGEQSVKRILRMAKSKIF